LDVEAALACHDEDPRPTIVTPLLDCKHLREHLAIAEQFMSVGISHGWSPRFQRPEE
jgi:hypothetical protein